uniref:GH18 domain-containing protein n=1 Tax=Plectus sambesii TaxID=2011161 RepID=A0A914XBW7_9BILA
KFSNFLIKLRKALRGLTASSSSATCPKTLGLRIPGWRLDLAQLYEIGVLNQGVDYVTMESYQTAGAESSTAKPLSPLYSSTSTDHSISSTLKEWVRQKLHGRKIVIVLPAFAIAHQLSNADFNRIGSPVSSAGLGDDKRFTRTQEELCQITDADKFMRELSFEQVAAFARAKNGAWLSYETRQTIKYKSNYARKLQLGGVGLLSLNDDDFSNSCRMGAFPLLSAIANTAQCN